VLICMAALDSLNFYVIIIQFQRLGLGKYWLSCSICGVVGIVGIDVRQ
jgi:hypothetical protein